MNFSSRDVALLRLQLRNGRQPRSKACASRAPEALFPLREVGEPVPDHCQCTHRPVCASVAPPTHPRVRSHHVRHCMANGLTLCRPTVPKSGIMVCRHEKFTASLPGCWSVGMTARRKQRDEIWDLSWHHPSARRHACGLTARARREKSKQYLVAAVRLQPSWRV